MHKFVEILVTSLSAFSPVVKSANTGSVYVTLNNCKIKQVRIANHNGHKTRRNEWELRTDAMTTRKQFNRVYNVKDINKMIVELKEKAL